MGQCHGTPVKGAERCRMHLGKRAQPVIAEAKLNEQAQAELARLDVPPVIDPLWELSKLAGQAVAWKDSMAGRVNELRSMRYESASGLEQLRSEIALWERALDRCVATLTAMAKLDIDARLVGIREQTADMLLNALEAALRSTGLDLEHRNAARQVFRNGIRVLHVPGEALPALAPVNQTEFVEAEIREVEREHPGLAGLVGDD